MMNPDKPEGVPLDEWLLAIGLAHGALAIDDGEGAWRIARAIAPGLSYENDAVFAGACGALYDHPAMLFINGHCDHYAAGAALAMALLAEDGDA